MPLPTKEGIRRVSLIFAAGTALFSDGYANGILTDVNTLLNRIYGAENVNRHNYGNTVRSTVFGGTIMGMLLFGWLSDKVGRRTGMMTATVLIFVFSGLSAASSGAHGSLGGLLAMLSAMRFLLGVGIGAEYPCGSVSASEFSESPGISRRAQHRWYVLATNTQLGLGNVTAAFVPLVLFWIFGENHLRAVWRISLGLGMVPAGLVFFWRLNMEEPERYRKDGMQYAKIPYLLVLKKYWPRLAAISFVWFLFDFVAFPFGIFSSTIIDNLTGGTQSLSVIFAWNLLILGLNVPGTIVGAMFVDYIGPKYCLIGALILQAIVGFIMSGLYKVLTQHVAAFVILYGVFQALGGIGPGNCIGLLAAKSCPTGVRGHFYGIAAAIGKLGAFVGTWVFPPIIDAFGGPHSERGNTGPFWIGGSVALLSATTAFFFMRPVHNDGLVELDREFREYLEEHGYDTSKMGIPGSEQTTKVGTIENEKDMMDNEKAGSLEEV
ncbi:hypothetical protein Agabi119p4_11579 [Agaricus bisporus var. burnettii]|uniref:Major facilitator superfamily (MFS) profile domain-containing protein n=1 Tax=Agaricus bisporus var. burnettii TaxID=192524 RepID=A0A8H7BVV8_AGABI|nr:hypothetical protein Agabi119p4_11579 [Agaricus bisporus var. burnettii]